MMIDISGFLEFFMICFGLYILGFVLFWGLIISVVTAYCSLDSLITAQLGVDE